MKTQLQQLLRVLSRYPQALHLVWEASPRYTVGITGLTLISALTTPAQIWLTKVLIDRVSGVVAASGSNQAVDWQTILTPAVTFILLLVVSDVSASLRNSLRDVLQLQVSNHARALILAKAASLDIAFYETPAFYDRLENALRDVWRTQNLPWILLDTTGSILSLLVTMGLLARLHPLAVPLLVLLAIPQLIARSRYVNLRFQVWTQRAPAQRMVNYLQGLLTYREPVKEIRLFGLEGPFWARFRQFNQQLVDEHKTILFAQERWTLLATLLSVAGVGTVWAYAIQQAALARITLGDLALAFQASEQVRNGLSQLFTSMGVFYEHSLFVGNLYDFLALGPDTVAGALERKAPGQPAPSPLNRPLQQGIEFRQVSFRYPGAERWVLQKVSFTIRPGITVAVVGENGAGKTTLIKLLTRFYDPTEGSILLDGRDLRDYDLADLRRAVGVIFQDFVRYHLTARENIGFGQLDKVDDHKRILRAAEKGGAVPVIEKLPNHYETLLGRTFEDSVDLSGGEWQKLALGRAFMREAQVLILDEPTAALDALAEYEVYKRFAELTADKTTIFISHRFSTVRMAQQILVLENGQLIEEGTHTELMTHNGPYAKMFTTQAERYL
ncbi:MAG: ABC transporter ATP-binding protein [Caldilineaceae bacterium]|nr:ABC transporter ATP-binding protein [Caldilineaceae bacterium]